MNSKVLVVDDSALIRQHVKRALPSAVFEVLEAQDGVEALAKANGTPDIALIICDLNMPRMNGLDFLEALRADDRFKAVPIVMLTTEAQPDLVARAKALGARGWIVKPFKPEVLTAAAKRLIPPTARV